MKLSVLICSIPDRLTALAGLLAELDQQIARLPPGQVEVMALTDSRRMILGDKRNRMIRAANGDYVVFIDDDDRIASDYLKQIMKLLDSEPDVATFPVEVTIDGGPPKVCYYSIYYPDQGEGSSHYWRWPNHLCVIRRDLVLPHPYPSIGFGEDTAFAMSIRSSLKTELAFSRYPLYYYTFDSSKSAVIKP